MALMEAVLVYRPHGMGGEEAIPIGKTDDPRILRALKARLLEEARRQASVWKDVDPGVFCLEMAEAERLARVLAFALPDEDLKPDLRLAYDAEGRDEEGRGPAAKQIPDPQST